MNESSVRPDEGLEHPRRRTLLNRLWALVALLACIELGWLTGWIVRGRSRREAAAGGARYVDAGLVETLPPGTVRAVPEAMLYLSRLEDGSLIALSRTCTHLGCAVPWNDKEQKFICPCHGSTFDRSGAVLSAPAIRPLDYFPVRVENGFVRIDTTGPQRRESFDPSQTTRV